MRNIQLLLLAASLFTLSTALAKGKIADTLVTTPSAKMAAQLNLDLRARCAAA